MLHPLSSVNCNIISGAESNIEGIVILYSITGGTVPELIVPSKVWLLPYTSDMYMLIGYVPPDISVILTCLMLNKLYHVKQIVSC